MFELKKKFVFQEEEEEEKIATPRYGKLRVSLLENGSGERGKMGRVKIRKKFIFLFINKYLKENKV